MMQPGITRPLPAILEGLRELALDLRWSGSRQSERLWQMLDAELWQRARDPLLLLQEISAARFEQAASDPAIRNEFDRVQALRQAAMRGPGWFAANYPNAELKTVAYFSLEFGLDEALPIYSGGLGVLAGDHLKTCSDMAVPLVGIGLLYDQGYFRQRLTPDGQQIESYPYNDPTSLPISPVLDKEDRWLRVFVSLPGRELVLRVWQAQVGRVPLYLLDSNDLLNSDWDRAITNRLYVGDKESRITQEIALGVGGWQLLQSLGIDAQVCHLNEGHAAFVVLARAIAFMEAQNVTFAEAFCATRIGNVFTTHTPVPAGFDSFNADLARRYLAPLAAKAKIPVEALLDMGRVAPDETDGPFNMAWLAAHGSGLINGVSRLHGDVSKPIFAPLYPRWPLAEIPIHYVTNAIHVPTWAAPQSVALWQKETNHGEHGAGEGTNTELFSTPDDESAILNASDSDLWAHRNAARKTLIDYVRPRLAQQLRWQGNSDADVTRAAQVLDPHALTLGFARRFAAYKRPNLLLHDMNRLAALLLHSDRPVQLIVAGKAHPGDDGGKRLVQELAQAAARPDLFDRLIFLSDYDMTLTSALVAGVDVWLNTPRRPMEASGTSGMKTLANGGVNVSELDGWWAEAYSPEVGFALGDGQEHGEDYDATEAEQLYSILEQQIVPEFYHRDGEGLPTDWLRRVRASMSGLTVRFSGPRMVREYVEQAYLPAASAYVRRADDGAKLAKELQAWQDELAAHWHEIRLAAPQAETQDGKRMVSVSVALGEVDPNAVLVELYADGIDRDDPERIPMGLADPDAAPNASGERLYRAVLESERAASDYTPRVIPFHPEALVPNEFANIAWRQ